MSQINKRENAFLTDYLIELLIIYVGAYLWLAFVLHPDVMPSWFLFSISLYLALLTTAFKRMVVPKITNYIKENVTEIKKMAEAILRGLILSIPTSLVILLVYLIFLELFN